MPTYDYQCDACNHKFELFQSITAEPERKCPQCKKLKLRRLFGTGAAVMFKGSGFYTTDYRSDSYKQAASADKGESKSSTSETKASDTKPKSSESSASSGKSGGSGGEKPASKRKKKE